MSDATPTTTAEPRPAPAAGAPSLCRACGTPWTRVRNVDTGKAVYLDLRSPVYVLFRTDRGELVCRLAGAWLWKALEAAPPAAAAMAALDAEIDAPLLKQMEAVEGFYASHMATCPAVVEKKTRKKPAAERAAAEG